MTRADTVLDPTAFSVVFIHVSWLQWLWGRRMIVDITFIQGS